MKENTNILSVIKKIFTLRSLVIIAVNIIIVILLFVGVRRLFAPSSDLTASSKVADKKQTPFKKEEEKSEPKAPISLLPQQPEQSIPIKAYKLAFTDFTDELPAVGTVRNIPEIELRFEVNGVIKNIKIKEGDKVKKQDLLATLDSKDVKLEIQWAQAKLNATEAEYKAALKRYQVVKRLYEIGAIIKARLDQLQAELEVSKAKIDISKKELQLSKVKLEKLDMKAPQAGIINKKEKDVGEFITPNDIIFTLLDAANTFVEIGVIEKDVFKIKSGQKVKVKVDTYPTRVFFGYVETVFPAIDERTRTLNIRVRVLDPGKLLKPGMFARVDVAVFRKKDALVVPSSSVSIQQGAYYAAMIEEEKIKYAPVTVEYITTDYAVIKKGLTEGALIVIETPGMKRFSAGTGIKIIETQEKLF
ncbi:MAG: efflux RND transporter periplasmic adaptor subunit [Candidatus Saelkia tenebricola]|nr:efflux RND transporter periplasmic adaptor subunit [Candidatus Saelkia tenebricola]